jgi:hypothetical protein
MSNAGSIPRRRAAQEVAQRGREHFAVAVYLRLKELTDSLGQCKRQAVAEIVVRLRNNLDCLLRCTVFLHPMQAKVTGSTKSSKNLKITEKSLNSLYIIVICDNSHSFSEKRQFSA